MKYAWQIRNEKKALKKASLYLALYGILVLLCGLSLLLHQKTPQGLVVAKNMPTIDVSNVHLPINEDKKIVEQFIGNVSMYNLGDKNQNDDTPCVGAFNENLCETKDLVIANNFYKKGTIVCIENVGCGRIADRMNSRYGKNHFDIATNDDKKVAIAFGRKNLEITVYKK